MMMIANPLPWPNGARCAVAITWDVDADSGLNYYNPDRADTLVATQSALRYDALVALPRILALCRHYGLRQTFFLPGWCIEKYSDAVGQILEDGHELALHGYLHERPNELSEDDERYWLLRGIAAFEKAAGRRPRGWRAPSFAFSKHSLRFLVKEGFDYDSSLMGDDVPYLLRDSAGTLLELPTEWTLDDWPHYVHNRDLRYHMPISAPQRAIEVFKAEFDAAWRHGALWISVWHPFVSGRLARLDAVAQLIEHMQDKGGVWFARLDEICDHVQAEIATGAWRAREEQLPLYTSPIPEFNKTPL